MGEKIVSLAQKLGVDPELVSLAMRVYVPPHIRVKNGKKENVDGYWRTVTRNSPLTNDEVKAIKTKAKELIGPDLKAGMKSPSIKVARRQAEIEAVNKYWNDKRNEEFNAIPPNVPDNPYDSLPRDAADIVFRQNMRKMPNLDEGTARALNTQQKGRDALPGGKDLVSPPRYKKGQRVRVDTEQGWEEGEVFAIAKEVVPGEGNRYEIKFDDGTHTNFGEHKVWPQKGPRRRTPAEVAEARKRGERVVGYAGPKRSAAEAKAILSKQKDQALKRRLPGVLADMQGAGVLDDVEGLPEGDDPTDLTPDEAYKLLQEFTGNGSVSLETLVDAGYADIAAMFFNPADVTEYIKDEYNGKAP